jgi:hypothetical protein
MTNANSNDSTSETAPETFVCDNCEEVKPITERERVALLEDWCTDCVDHYDLPPEIESWRN